MKWIDARRHNPSEDGYYIVGWQSSSDNSLDVCYEGRWFMDGKWIYSEEDEDWNITHFIIPDKLPND